MFDVLLVRPGRPEDSAERTAYLFADELHTLIAAGGTGCRVLHDLSSTEAVRADVESVLGSNPSPEGAVFAFYGHGCSKTLKGYDGAAAVDEQNANLLKDLHVYAVACSSMKELGPAAVAVGVKSYVGYKGRHVFVHAQLDGSIPSGFRECANIGLTYAMRKGDYVAEDVFRVMSDEYERWTNHYADELGVSVSVVTSGDLEVHDLDVELEKSKNALWNLSLLEHNRMYLDFAPRNK